MPSLLFETSFKMKFSLDFPQHAAVLSHHGHILFFIAWLSTCPFIVSLTVTQDHIEAWRRGV